MKLSAPVCAALILALAPALPTARAEGLDYRVLATSKTSTMEKELNQAGEEGYRFSAVMGGESFAGGKEVIVIVGKPAAEPGTVKRTFKLLATSKTSTMQKEMQQLGDEGYQYQGQTVFPSAFGGKEVVVILQRDPTNGAPSVQYRLLATSRTSTMQKELQEAAGEGFQLMGMTISKTAVGGAELVCILSKTTR